MPHLTEEERNRLERYLGKNLSFRNIAESMGKAPSTISREVLKHRIPSRKTAETLILNNCLERAKCSISGLCRKQPLGCRSKCSECQLHSCNELCRMFSPEECPRLVNAPYVCNGCRHERQCSLTKYYYVAGIAHPHDGQSSSSPSSSGSGGKPFLNKPMDLTLASPSKYSFL